MPAELNTEAELTREIARLRAELARREREAADKELQLERYAADLRETFKEERGLTQQLTRSYRATVRALSNAVEFRDAYTGKLAQREGHPSNVADAVIRFQQVAGNDDFAVRLMSQAIGSGHACDLIGAFIIPESTSDLDWNPQTGIDTARFVRKLTAPEDKLQIRQLVVGCEIA